MIGLRSVFKGMGCNKTFAPTINLWLSICSSGLAWLRPLTPTKLWPFLKHLHLNYDSNWCDVFIARLNSGSKLMPTNMSRLNFDSNDSAKKWVGSVPTQTVLPEKSLSSFGFVTHRLSQISEFNHFGVETWMHTGKGMWWQCSAWSRMAVVCRDTATFVRLGSKPSAVGRNMFGYWIILPQQNPQ